MIYSIKNKDDLKDFEQLTNLQSEVKQIKLEDGLDHKGFY